MTHMQPFFAALQDIIRGSEPGCGKCGGSGETGDGNACNWCDACGTPAVLTPEQKRAEQEMLQAIRDGKLPRW